MDHIFISHAGADAPLAEQLCSDLKNVGHDAKVDTREMRLGDNLIDFMNEGIANSHTVIVIFSTHTDTAAWQKKEIDAAIWNQQEHSGGKVVVMTVGQVQLPPLLGPLLYGRIDGSNYKRTLEKLCRELAERRSDTAIVSRALKEHSTNPFWRVRAEYFDEAPQLLADSFSPPDAEKIHLLEEMKPCFLEGSRGTGKTMLLLSMRARTYSARNTASSTHPNLFGCYLRLDRGAISNAGRYSDLDQPDVRPADLDLAQLSDVFAQEFYLGVLESILSELSFCRDSLRIRPVDEAALAKSIIRELLPTDDDPTGDSLDSLSGLLVHLSRMRRRLAEFIRRKFIYKESATVPFTCFDIDALTFVVRELREKVEALSDRQVTILLDEYENLFPYQKVVVNTLVKLGPPKISIKVARKVGTQETSDTSVGQELQETHDYNRLPLIYSVESDEDFARYVRLLNDVVQKTLSVQGLEPMSIADLLPKSQEDEIDRKVILDEIRKICSAKSKDFDSFSDAEKRRKVDYYSEAAIYRQLYGRPGRRTKKRFAGHKDLAFVSSGVIRYFQEIVGLAYYLQAEATGTNFPISPEHQSRAVHTVSGYNLATLSRNVERYGERLKYLLLDLGDCLRQKLLHHASEPEAGRLAIADPERMELSETLRNVELFLNLGVREGVFQLSNGRPGMRPKHVEDPQPLEFNIARIFAPVLEISPRLRWSTLVHCHELAGLLEPNDRKKTKRSILQRIVAGPKKPPESMWEKEQ